MPEETELSAGDSSTPPSAWEAAHWSDLQALYHLAAEAPPGERTRILRAATEDEALVERVLDLLSSDSAGTPEDAAPAPRVLAAIGGRVGPYRLIRLLGTGGLGAVYLAERVRGGAVQQCALKVLSLHAAGPAMEARFLREQQIIATLDHPHITRMLDAGFSDDGQPFLAMEFVDGKTLTEHCDDLRLSTRERLALFLQVCDAVAYAHRMLVVHLDLKPSNILVTGAGSAKLLDFGTSKLVETEAALTTTVLATPAYASPEQMRGQPVSTACDVYGLGAVLYELLTGSRPWGAASAVLVIEHALREDEPPPLADAVQDTSAEPRSESSAAALRQSLRGDLTSIVNRCLRSRPSDRYATTDALRDDVQRYLDGRPVLTRPQTLRYRAARFIGRNRLAVTGSAAAVLLVLASLAYAAVRQHQALVAANRAVQMQRFLTELFKTANSRYTGKPAATVPEFLRLGATVLPQVIRDPEDQRAARLSLGSSMLDDGSYVDARTTLEGVAREAHRTGDVATEAEAASGAGLAAYRSGDIPAGRALSAEALQLATHASVPLTVLLSAEENFVMQRYEQEDLHEADLNRFRETVFRARRGGVPQDQLAAAMLALSEAEDKAGRLAEEQQLATDALHIYQSEPWAVCGVAEAANVLGFLRQQTNDLRGSVAMFRTSYADYEQCEGPEGRDTLSAAGYLGLSMVPAKLTREAIPLLQDLIPRLERVRGKDVMDLRAPMLALARSYLTEKRYVEAEETIAKLDKMLAGKIPANSLMSAADNSVWARALAGQGKYREALAHIQDADRIYNNAKSLQPAARDNAAMTHAFLLEMQAKVAAEQK